MSIYHVLPGKMISVPKGGFERIKAIEQEVCKFYSIPVQNLSIKSRKRESNSEPFHVCCTMLLEFTYICRNNIAEKYNRDRCSTYHAQKAISNLEFSSFEFREKIYMLRASLTTKFLSNETIPNHLDGVSDPVNLQHDEGCAKRLCECEG